MRQELMICKKPLLEEAVQQILGVRLRGLYTDISTRTGERVIVMTLQELPAHLEQARELAPV
jgi:uncharacterized protein YbcI